MDLYRLSKEKHDLKILGFPLVLEEGEVDRAGERGDERGERGGRGGTDDNCNHLYIFPRV